MATLWQDVRYGLRMLGRSPGFTAVVLLVVGLGIGANTALFNALDQVYLRPLPVKKPHELVSVQYLHRMPDGSLESVVPEFGYPDYEAQRDRSAVLAGLAAFARDESVTARSGEVAEKIQGMAVSVNYFSLLGLRPALGRLFAAPQEQADGTCYPVAVISHELWRRYFGGRVDVLGRQPGICPGRDPRGGLSAGFVPGYGGPGAGDRVRQCRESAVGPRRDTAERDRRPAGARGRTHTRPAAVVGGEFAPGQPAPADSFLRSLFPPRHRHLGPRNLCWYNTRDCRGDVDRVLFARSAGRRV